MRLLGALMVGSCVLGCDNGEPNEHALAAGAGGAIAGGGAAGRGGTSEGGSGAGLGGSAAGSGATSSGMSGSGSAAANVYVDELRLGAARDACFPRSLPFGAPGGPDDGRLSCWIAEAHAKDCDCNKPGRTLIDAASLDAVKKQMQRSGSCDGDSGIACASVCACLLQQPPGTATDESSPLYACQNAVAPAEDLFGYCGLDQTHVTPAGELEPIGAPALVTQCPPSARHRLRFVGEGVPDLTSVGFIGCTGAILQ
jgi:hypothetical protein